MSRRPSQAEKMLRLELQMIADRRKELQDELHIRLSELNARQAYLNDRLGEVLRKPNPATG